jgi:hypothetical protein
MTAAMPERRSATEQFSGVIERVTSDNEDSGLYVLRVKTKGHGEETTVAESLRSVRGRPPLTDLNRHDPEARYRRAS